MAISSIIEHPLTEEAAAQSASVQRRQLTLRGLFLCMTYFAISSALAKAIGLGVFVLMNGALLTWLSFRGYLWWMQTNRARPKVYGVGWMIFAASFALPAFVFRGCGGTPEVHYGWQAALETASGVEGVYKLAEKFVVNPEQWTMTGVKNVFVWFFMVLFWNLPNFLMLVSPFVLYRQQRGKGGYLSAIICCAAVSTWTWGLTDGSQDLLIGYYVWSGGVTIISLARRPNRRTLLIMGLLGILLVGINWLM